jgi:2-oxoglutarate ferredoxin oxidoreductase subunit beta
MVKMHDGSWLRLHKLSQQWNPEDKIAAMNVLKTAHEKNEILTGLIYINEQSRDLHEILKTSDTPLNRLDESVLTPGADILEKLNSSFR